MRWLFAFICLFCILSLDAQNDSLNYQKYQKQLYSLQKNNSRLSDSLHSLKNQLENDRLTQEKFRLKIDSAIKKSDKRIDQLDRGLAGNSQQIDGATKIIGIFKPISYTAISIAIACIILFIVFYIRFRRHKKEQNVRFQSFLAWQQDFEARLNKESALRSILKTEMLVEIHKLLEEQTGRNETKMGELQLQLINLTEARILNVFDTIEAKQEELKEEVLTKLKRRKKKWKIKFREISGKIEFQHSIIRDELKELDSLVKKMGKKVKTIKVESKLPASKTGKTRKTK